MAKQLFTIDRFVCVPSISSNCRALSHLSSRKLYAIEPAYLIKYFCAEIVLCISFLSKISLELCWAKRFFFRYIPKIFLVFSWFSTFFVVFAGNFFRYSISSIAVCLSLLIEIGWLLINRMQLVLRKRKI